MPNDELERLSDVPMPYFTEQDRVRAIKERRAHWDELIRSLGPGKVGTAREEGTNNVKTIISLLRAASKRVNIPIQYWVSDDRVVTYRYATQKDKEKGPRGPLS